MDDFYVGPFTTAVGDGELLTEVRLPLRPGAGSAHEKVERRAGDWAIAAASAAALARRRDDRRRRHRAQRGRARPPSTSPRAEELLRARRRRRSCSPRRARSRRRTARRSPTAADPVDYKRHLAGVLTKRALRRAAARAQHAGGLTMQVTITINGEQVSRDVEPRQLLVHFIRDTLGPDRHPLGLRHLELRRLRGADGRRAGQVVHDARGDVRGPRDPHRRVARGGRPARPDPAGLPRDARAPVRLLHARGC